MKKEKSIPTIIGLILLLITLFFGIKLVTRQTNISSQASGSCQPINLQITNITNNSASISFTTSDNCLSTISLSGRTIKNNKDKGKIHYFEIGSLKESQVYTFFVISDGEKYSSDNYNFKTAQKPSGQIPDSNLAWGRVYNPDQTPATEAIVYFSVLGASPLSALVTSTGDWHIALATSFNESLTNYFSSSSDLEENIVVINYDQTQTQIVSSTNHNNPVPDIIIGQNNFSIPSPVIELPQASLLDNEYNFSNDVSLTISNPDDNETLSTKRPEFFGTAQPGAELKIEVHSSPAIDSSVSTDKEGNWDWSPSQDLTPGEHTITVTDKDNNTISKKFIVLAAESNTSFIASSSATPTQKPTPTSIPTSVPSTSSGIPKTGNTTPTGIILVISLISIFSAFIFYKKY
jgi:hypothetical protein